MLHRLGSAVLVAIGDTHATDDHRLSGAVLEAVREADVVVHTGDFTHEPVLDALEREAADLVAVAGNNDGPPIRARVPDTQTVEALGRRFTVTHGHQHDDTARSLLARQEGADVLVVGHSHRPGIRRVGEVWELNPGSYADPRWYEPAFGVVEREGGDLRARLVRPDGTDIDATGL